MASDGGRVSRAPRLRARAGSAAGGEGRSGGRAARVGSGREGWRGFGLGVRRARDRGGAPVRLGGSVLSCPIFYKSHVVIICIIPSRWIGYAAHVPPSTAATIQRWFLNPPGFAPFLSASVGNGSV